MNMTPEQKLKLITDLNDSVRESIETFFKSYVGDSAHPEKGMLMSDVSDMNLQAIISITALMYSMVKGQADGIHEDTDDKDLARSFTAMVIGTSMDEIQTGVLPKIFDKPMAIAVARVMLDRKIGKMSGSESTDNNSLRSKIMHPESGASFTDVLNDIKKKAH
jgi:hypothetical protein